LVGKDCGLRNRGIHGRKDVDGDLTLVVASDERVVLWRRNPHEPLESVDNSANYSQLRDDVRTLFPFGWGSGIYKRGSWSIMSTAYPQISRETVSGIHAKLMLKQRGHCDGRLWDPVEKKVIHEHPRDTLV
jgi:hypothetical protein